MKIQVRLFAAARDLVGVEHVEIDLAEGSTICDLRRSLYEQFPQLEPLAQHVRFAAGSEYVQDTHRIDPADDVAVIPPVSGG